MYTRLLKPRDSSYFLLGPRGTGKTSWVRRQVVDATYLDLLESELFQRLHASPGRLADYIVNTQKPVVIDEIQKIPALLDEVHRLIESQGLHFVLTGSSARKLRRQGVNLLAGRALTRYMHPLTADELGEDFDIARVLRFGCLPSIFGHSDPSAYLRSYVATYLKEEVLQEGLTRNLGAFSRFLEAASFAQGNVLNMSAVARECGIERKLAENYFSILEDLLIAYRLPVFTRKARRDTVKHPKFYYFDTGVYRTIRPAGPLDEPESIEGVALETLVLQQLRAFNDYRETGYSLYYWRTRDRHEVDFVLYGERGLIAIEVKRASRVRSEDLRSLRAFLNDYPVAQAYLLYGGTRAMNMSGVSVQPVQDALQNLSTLLRAH